ncbi:MAG: HD-like signal output (HDOD) protein [Planctomycetota bacterium]|jgi:HD-like signal output (HDOD) protein
MLSWLIYLLRGKRPNIVRVVPKTKGPRRLETEAKAQDEDESSDEMQADEDEEPELIGGIDNLDRSSSLQGMLKTREQVLFERVSCWVEKGKFDLPMLPATNVAAMNLAANPGADLSEIVDLIASDPVLSSELLKIANSVVYATEEPADTLHAAVMRIGMRGLRSLIYSVSIKGAILTNKSLAHYSEEVWRQSYSVGTIARKIAPLTREDPEKAFLLGLLHDLGKVVLLSLLGKGAERDSEITPSIVGRVFYQYHERVGGMVAEKWKLSDELISVAGNHHDFENNEEFGRSAALANLSHRIDLYLSMGQEDQFRGLAQSAHMDVLGLHESDRHRALSVGRQAFLDLRTKIVKQAELEEQGREAA